MIRNQTKPIKISNIVIGGNSKVLIQSMCNIKTSKVCAVTKQINQCANNGADIMRVSILDEKDAKALKKIKNGVQIPIVADIHFDYKLALLSIENGADAIRINPNNISKEKIKIIINECKKKNLPIRLGINASSFKNPTVETLIENVKNNIEFLEKLDFKNIVISLKSSDVLTTIKANQILSRLFKYPIHLGLTESGPNSVGIIKSVSALAPLLLEGIGNTIRISLSSNPVNEILVCKRFLHSLNLYDDYPTLISCPTCGRTRVKDVFQLSDKILNFLEKNNINKKVSIMGCVVNGPGEAKKSDVGIVGIDKNTWALFKNGVFLKKISDKDIYKELIKTIVK
ncbi:MAG: flavodoxin-dependent (E)-4-hydroxy-3-methylbut-2-enyl-diphosphate synthase [Bacilli bacterium]|nr:flavodoxin-dependent (E)-4-hydroxy-3-methylbut-2-enyl-diphosphate synthase [Bacilli bacterium]